MRQVGLSLIHIYVCVCVSNMGGAGIVSRMLILPQAWRLGVGLTWLCQSIAFAFQTIFILEGYMQGKL